MVVGVHSRYLGLPFAEALRSLKVKRAWVVNGDEGLDEISPEGTTHVSGKRDFSRPLRQRSAYNWA